MSTKQKYLLILGGLVLALLIRLMCTNKIDPRWTALDENLNKDFFTLSEAQDSIAHLFSSVHDRLPAEEEIKMRLATPFMPTMEFSKFQKFTRKVLKDKFLVFTSINGSGASTLVNRISRFVATSEEHILRAVGVPHFDLEYHKQYIGKEFDGQYRHGLLIDFIDKAKENPNDKFLFVFDEIDKIEPETFFGAQLWYELYDASVETIIEGKEISFPDNFYMVSVNHIKPNPHNILTDQHYRRIGKMTPINASTDELILYLQGRHKKESKDLSEIPGIKEFVYAFDHSNEIVTKKYNYSYTLGQWSPVRKMYAEGKIDEFKNYFLFHVNSLGLEKEMTLGDLSPVDYALNHNGKLKGSNFLSMNLKTLEEKGFLTEFIVGLSFILVSGISSFFFLRRRERIISQQIKRVELLFREFEAKQKDYDTISTEINMVKEKVDNLALSKKINYQEATFFYQYFYDKSRKVEIAKEAYHHFNDLLEVSLEDGILSDSEYTKLINFLDRIKNRIGDHDYSYFKKEIDRVHSTYSEN